MTQLIKTSLEENLTKRFETVTQSTPLEDIFSLVDAASIASSDVSLFVENATTLPNLSDVNIPDGQIVFVRSINLHVVSWRKQWMSLDGRVFRNDGKTNTIWTWGCNNRGQLGDNTAVSRSSPVSVVGGFTDWCQVSAGTAHTAAVRTNGTIWTWGENGTGRLGDNTAVSRSSPVSVVGGFTDWCQVSASVVHTAAVRTNGTIWAWGCNGNGRLGDNTTVPNSSPVSVVGGFTDWCQVSTGQSHTTAIRTNGTIWSWGYNSCGQLGDNTIVDKSSPVSVVGGFTDWCQVSAGGYHTAAVRSNCTIWTWGCNNCGQLGDNTIVSRSSPVSVVGGFTDWCQVSVGCIHTAAVRTNGTIWAWGYNAFGRLGDGSSLAKSSPVSVVGGFTDWCQVSAGNAHTAAVRTNGTIWTWGENGTGRLGDNTTTNRSSPVSVVGGFTDWCQVSAGCGHSTAVRAT